MAFVIVFQIEVRYNEGEGGGVTMYVFYESPFVYTDNY